MTIVIVAMGLLFLITGIFLVWRAWKTLSFGFFLLDMFLVLFAAVPFIIACTNLDYYFSKGGEIKIVLIPGIIALMLLAIPIYHLRKDLFKKKMNQKNTHAIKKRGGKSRMLHEYLSTFVHNENVRMAFYIIFILVFAGITNALMESVLIGTICGLIICFVLFALQVHHDNKYVWRTNLENFLGEIEAYIQKPGCEKRARMCLDVAKQCYSKVNQIDAKEREEMEKVSRAMRLFMVKERDWASAGGAASAIGGTAAGVITALNIQAQNEKIREHNSSVRSMGAHLALNSTDSLKKQRHLFENEAKRWEELSEKARTMSVSMRPMNKLMDMLQPRIIDTKRDEHNVLWISAEIKKANLMIKGTVPGVVDGVFRAVLKNGDKEVGEAFFALPLEGAAQKQHLNAFAVKINSYNLKVPRYDKIDLEPVSLWAIEDQSY